MIGGALRFGQVFAGRRRDNAVNETSDLPEMWRYWQYTEEAVKNAVRSHDPNSASPKDAKARKKAAA